MYSFKKILSLVIGIAAAGVATADDTSASSVSLSLSLTNVVPSNKVGKQTKAGKQVKAAVLGKAVKAKAIKYDNSLSSSMSMSYGPEPKPDPSPDYDPGLQAYPPDQIATRAGLKFQVSAFHEALAGRYTQYTVDAAFTVYAAAIAESYTKTIVTKAGVRALARGLSRVNLGDIHMQR